MNADKLRKIIENKSPLSLQESWDNSGFQILFADRDIEKVLVSLEITEDIIEEAAEMGVQLIVTHHPLIFSPIKSICDDDITGNYIMNLITHRISVYSSHTPFDKCSGGNNDRLAELLGLKNISSMKEDESGICRVGEVEKAVRAEELIHRACEAVGIDSRFAAFCGNLNSKVKRIGLCSGAGADYIKQAIDSGCDLFITGDVKYHQARFVSESRDKISVLDIGHYGSEKIFTANMASYLRENTDLEIIESKAEKNPFEIF